MKKNKRNGNGTVTPITNRMPEIQLSGEEATQVQALDHNLARIADDHANARRLGELLSDCPALRPSVPETNIVMLDLVRETDSSETVIPRLARAGVLVVPFGPRRLRAVTHLDVSRGDVERAARLIAETLR